VEAVTLAVLTVTIFGAIFGTALVLTSSPKEGGIAGTDALDAAAVVVAVSWTSLDIAGFTKPAFGAKAFALRALSMAVAVITALAWLQRWDAVEQSTTSWALRPSLVTIFSAATRRCRRKRGAGRRAQVS